MPTSPRALCLPEAQRMGSPLPAHSVNALVAIEEIETCKSIFNRSTLGHPLLPQFPTSQTPQIRRLKLTCEGPNWIINKGKNVSGGLPNIPVVLSQAEAKSLDIAESRPLGLVCPRGNRRAIKAGRGVREGRRVSNRSETPSETTRKLL